MVTVTQVKVQALCLRNVMVYMQAAQLTMPLEKRFGKRLQRSTSHDAELSAAPLQKRGRPVGKYQGVSATLTFIFFELNDPITVAVSTFMSQGSSLETADNGSF